MDQIWLKDIFGLAPGNLQFLSWSVNIGLLDIKARCLSYRTRGTGPVAAWPPSYRDRLCSARTQLAPACLFKQTWVSWCFHLSGKHKLSWKAAHVKERRKSIFLKGTRLQHPWPCRTLPRPLCGLSFVSVSPGLDRGWAPCGLLDLWVLLHAVVPDGRLPELRPEVHHPHRPHWL